VNRRELLAQLALVTGSALASPFAQAALKGARLHERPAASVLSQPQQQMVEQLAELIIPRTDTAGAIDAGVPTFIDQIVTVWYTPTERRIFLDGLTDLDAYCTKSWGKSFSACDSQQQVQALTSAEQSSASYQQKAAAGIRGAAPDESSPFFYKLKMLTVLGYYTSELGSQQELSYNPVPGRYEGDIDFDKVGRQWSY
jgi:hypothetical protein